MQIVKDIDRAAPLGTGHIKVGGNYAGSLRASERAKAEGFSAVLFLEAKEKKYIDEAGPANFFAIKDNKYIMDIPAILCHSYRAYCATSNSYNFLTKFIH
jgi:branched-chain amino acid aminotransferase